jgi:HEAT repeat protein
MEEKLILEMLDSPYVENRLLAVEFLSNSQEPSLAAVLRVMEDEALPVREQAVDLAARHLPVERLVGLVGNHGNAVLRNSAIEALKRTAGRGVRALLGALSHPDPEVVMFVTQILGDLPGEVDPHPLLELVSNPDTNIAQAAIETLGKHRAREAVPRLLDVLDCEFWLQFAAIAALGEIGDRRAVPRLLALLDDELCQIEVLVALGKIADVSTLPALVELWERSDRLPLRDHITLAVARICSARPHDGPSTLEPCLARALESDASRNQALRYLSNALGPRPKEGLISLPDLELRRAAVIWLSRFPRVEAGLEQLVVWLGDSALQESLSAVFESLGARGVPALRRGLDAHQPQEVRRCAARLLGRLGDRSSLRAFLQLLHDPSLELQEAAADALGALGDPAVISALLPLLASPAHELREAAARSLSQFEAHTLVPSLVAYLDEAPESAWEVGLDLVARIPDARFAPLLRRALRSVDVQIARAAVRAAARTPTLDLLTELAPLLERGAPSVRVQAIDALGTNGGAGAGELLLGRLGSSEAERYYVVRALGDLHFAPAVEILLAHLENFESFDTRTRLAALEALGKIGGPKAETFLAACLQGPHLEERRSAAAALAAANPAAYEETFLSLAVDEDWRLRNIAAYGLGACLGPEVPQVLQRLVSDPESVVARTALESLSRRESA